LDLMRSMVVRRVPLRPTFRVGTATSRSERDPERAVAGRCVALSLPASAEPCPGGTNSRCTETSVSKNTGIFLTGSPMPMPLVESEPTHDPSVRAVEHNSSLSRTVLGSQVLVRARLASASKCCKDV
jgi:hypothetical protein